MSAEITSPEAKGAVALISGAVLSIIGGVFKLLRLQSQINRLRARIIELEDAAEKREAALKDEAERIKSAVKDEVQKAIALLPPPEPPPVRQTTGNMPTTLELERIVDEKVKAHVARADGEQNAKIDGISVRVGDVARMLAGVVGKGNGQ